MWLVILGLAGTLRVVDANFWTWSRDRLERWGTEAMGFDAGDTCGFTRADGLACIARYVDVNHDKEISPWEFERAKHKYLPTQARLAAWAAHKFGYDITIDDVMNGCDVAPKDGHLTLSDWEGGAKTCLPGKGDLCKLKTVCDIAAKQAGP